MNPGTTVRLFKALAIAVAIAAPAEGLRHVAYQDSGGITTICYGSTENVRPGQTASMAECHGRLSADMLKALIIVDKCVPGLPDHMLAAWGDAVFNLGPTIVCDKKKSTAARLLAENKLEEACNELPKWNKAAGVVLPGLTSRREREKKLCLSGTL